MSWCGSPAATAPASARYRLAGLAERFGADADLEDVLAAISANCPRQRESYLGRRCQAYTNPREG
jgi:hypothetical protein